MHQSITKYTFKFVSATFSLCSIWPKKCVAKFLTDSRHLIRTVTLSLVWFPYPRPGWIYDEWWMNNVTMKWNAHNCENNENKIAFQSKTHYLNKLLVLMLTPHCTLVIWNYEETLSGPGQKQLLLVLETSSDCTK